MKCKTIIIKDFDHLREIFPTLTDTDVCRLYRGALKGINRCNELAGSFDTEVEENANMEKWGMLMECADYLAGYLAQRYLEICGLGVS